jgi:acyl carrier protein
MLRKDYLEETNQSSIDGSVYTQNDVINIISSVLDEEEITEYSTMFNTASWDSLNHMLIMVELFEKTKISFSPIQISNATSVLSITQLLNSKSCLNK